MGIANKLLKLAAKVAVDRALGKERTDELVQLLSDWSAERDKAKALAVAKEQIDDPRNVIDAVWNTIRDMGANFPQASEQNVQMTVAAGLAGFDEPPSEDQVWDTFLPGVSKTYVIASDASWLTGGNPGRFLHFNWYKEGWRVRDFIGRRMLHPPKSSAMREKGWEIIEYRTSVLNVWVASTVRIQAVSRHGLDFAITDQERWSKVLGLLTESGRQVRKSNGQPDPIGPVGTLT
ncbi:MAG: hypothetical protein U0835_00485 [Isosphaeraceae bacterium]